MGIVNMHYPELWGYVFFCEDENITYSIPADEELKWEMRKIYYQLHESYDKTGKFDKDFVKSSIAAKINVMQKSFEIICINNIGEILVLRDDGKIQNHGRR